MQQFWGKGNKVTKMSAKDKHKIVMQFLLWVTALAKPQRGAA